MPKRAVCVVAVDRYSASESKTLSARCRPLLGVGIGVMNLAARHSPTANPCATTHHRTTPANALVPSQGYSLANAR
jgi:hypothetical protein